ncbi:MAG: flagellar filament protein FlaA [Spirochaetes bacterium]|nr:MAG: flagellar filament protein FlaA [Spirochaetota bacterium]
MKKIIIAVFLVSVIGFAGFAQATSNYAGTGIDAAKIGIDSAQQMLKEISVSKFEDAGFWIAAMPSDQGIVAVRRLPGAPAGRKPIKDEEVVGIKEADKYVLGVRVNFYKRGFNSITVSPVRPLPIEGITKTISVWVVGRNYNHTLKMMIEDFMGRKQELTVGKLNFMGWKRLTVAVPPSVIQTEYHYTNQMGIKFLGFKIDFDPMESYGSYYIYFDDLRAVTDLFPEVQRDSDDMSDGW